MEMFKAFSGRLKVLGVLFFSALFVSDIRAELVSVYPEGSGPYGYWTSLVLDSSDAPHMVYRDGSSGGNLRYVRKVGSSWVGETIESGFDSSGGHASIGLTSSGEPRVSYYKNGQGLKHARRTNSSWTVSILDPEGGQYTSLKVAPSGKTFISYYANNKLKFAKWDGVAWTTSTVDQGGNVGLWTSLALDGSENPVISYYDSTKSDLKLAQWDGTAWSTQTVVSAGDAGKYSSLALDSNGRPSISYWANPGGIQFARWNGSGWDIQTVSARGESYTSLAFDELGNPKIAFGSSSGGILYLASLNSSLWTLTVMHDSESKFPSLDWSKAGDAHISHGSTFFNYTVVTPLNPPTNLIVITRSTDTITWRWTDNSISESGFRVLKAPDLTLLSGDLPTNTTQWTQSGLTPNTSSQIIVQVINGPITRNSAPSELAFTNALTPTAFRVDTANSQSVSFSWATGINSPETSYSIEMLNSSSIWTTVFSGRGSTATVSGLTEETNYTFRAKAINGNLISTAYTNTISTRTLPPPLASPGQPSVGSREVNSLTWVWTDRSTDEIGFHVIRSSDSFDLSGELPANTTWWIQTGLGPNEGSQVKVYSYNAKGISTSISSQRRFSLANPPTDTVVASSSGPTATISWSVNNNPIHTNYALEKSTNGVNFSGIYLGTAPIAEVNSLDDLTTHYFRVKTLNGESLGTDYGNLVLVYVPLQPPTAPGTPFSIAATTGSVTWSWNDNSIREDGFRILNAVNGEILTSDLPSNSTQWTHNLPVNSPSKIIALAFNGSGSNASFASPVVYSLANPPTGSHFNGDIGKLTLSFSANGNPNGTIYNVERSVNNVDFSTDVYGSTNTSVILSNRNIGTTYYYRVKAINGNGASTAYDVVVSTVNFQAPPNGTPENLDVDERTENSLTWAWTDNSTNEQGFRVIDNHTGTNLSGDLPAGTTYWIQTGLSPNTSYEVQIEVFTHGGLNRSSRSYYKNISEEFTLANPPTNLAVTHISTHSIRLTWEPDGNPVGTRYIAYYSEIEDGDYDDFFIGTTSSATATNLRSDTKYYFLIKSLNGNGIPSDSLAEGFTTLIGDLLSSAIITPGVERVVRMNGRSGMVRVTFPSQCFSYPTSVQLESPSSFPKGSSPALKLSPTGVGVRVGAPQPKTGQKVAIEVAFRPQDVTSRDVSRLILARFEEKGKIWVPLPSTVDPIKRTVTGTTDHFSDFQIMEGIPPTDLSQVVIYPNPFNANYGDTQIHFSNLPVNSIVTLLTLEGRRVAQLVASPGGVADWNVVNDDGETVAGGVYYVRIEGGGSDSLLKVVVQR